MPTSFSIKISIYYVDNKFRCQNIDMLHIIPFPKTPFVKQEWYTTNKWGAFLKIPDTFERTIGFFRKIDVKKVTADY